jgi:hypothetical protein
MLLRERFGHERGAVTGAVRPTSRSEEVVAMVTGGTEADPGAPGQVTPGGLLSKKQLLRAIEAVWGEP